MEDIYKNLKHGRLTVWSINLLIWIIMFLSPLVFLNHGRGMTLIQYICMCAAPLAILVVYYTNFLLLAPRYYIKGKKNIFWASNLVLVLILSVCLHLWMENMRELWAERPMPPVPPVNDLLPFGHRISFFLRDMFYMAVAAAVATTVYISMRWQAAENARREAEKARAEAELKNLRAQINPHFLLNTLNNIYALTAINTPKAQQAILQLGKLLRHVLYDNDQPQVSLASEIEFITNYVNLMKIRFAGNVDIRMDTNVAPSANLTVAPLIFISLIENAFKHGVSPTMPSFIHITIEGTEAQITCTIENSCFPKTSADKSGHGIGLQQVQQRLNLMYGDRYTWQKGANKENTIYTSKIILYETQLRNN